LTAVVLVGKVARVRPRVDWKYLTDAVKLGSRPYLRDIFQVMTLTFTAYYLEVVGFSAEELGYFSVAATAMTVLWQVPETIHLVLANRLASQRAEDRAWFTPLVCRNMFFATCCAALVLGAAAEWFVRFWAPKYVGCVPALRVLLAGSAVYSLFKVLQTDLMARGRVNAVPLFAGLTFSLLVASTVLVVSVLGQRTILAAALCCSAAMTATGLATLFYYCRLARRSPLELVLLRRADVSLWLDAASKAWGRVAGRAGSAP
jgi:O-antigen/teichoic acid export membrane protein